MNRAIIAKHVRKAPAAPEKAYIFINDNRQICEAIATVGFMPLYIAKSGDSFFTEETLCDFIRDTANMGTEIMNYIFVLACFRKKTNDTIEYVLKNNLIPYKVGAYTLFKNKEYLAKYEKQDELEKTLSNYIKRFEGNGSADEEVDKAQFCIFSENGAVKGILDLAVVRYLKEAYCMFVVGRELYLYRDGCYFVDNDGIRIKAIVTKLLPERFVNYRNLAAIYNLLIEQQDLQKTMEELNNFPPWWINFRNCMFDVKEWKMYRHKTEYLSTNQIPHELNPAARENLDERGTETRKFLAAALPDPDDQMTLWQYLGYSMTRDTRFQKMLIIRGVGGTGKSKVINLMQDIVGAENCSGISLQDLSERFYPSMLYGKLLNACADISADALMQVDNIKKATGEDVMICEKKNKDPKPFRSYAKLLFSANKIPLNLDEKSNAFYRRLLILEMNNMPKVKDMELGDKLRAETDYSIWMALSALRKLHKDGEFTESAGCKERVEELYREADTVKAFTDECLEQKEGSRIRRKLLYDKYVEYCQSYGRKHHSPNVFYKSLAEKGFFEYRTSSDRYFKDLDFKDEGFLPLDE